MLKWNFNIFCNVLFLMIFLCILFPSVLALETRSGDTIEINSPIDDDLIASGGSMVVNAPVKSITWLGGTLIVNQPVETNLVAAGGTVQVNAPVGTDLIAAGGNIDINDNVGGKVLAAGGSVTMNGNAENLVVAGGTFIQGKNSVISKDANIRTSGFTTLGTILGNLTVEKNNNDKIFSSKLQEIVTKLFIVAFIIHLIGLLILGIIIAKLLPGFFSEVISTGKNRPVVSFIAGMLGIIISFALFIVLIITIIGIPIAIFWILLVILGLILSTIMTGGTLGVWIYEKMQKKTEYSPIVYYRVYFT